MFRKLVIGALLIPLPFNGLWMVCEEDPSVAAAPSNASEKSQAEVECEKICAMERPVTPGAACVLTSDEEGVSLLVISFGTAVLPAVTPIPFPEPERQRLSEISGRYSNPNLPGTAPPPRI